MRLLVHQQLIFCSDTASQITHFSRQCVLRHYGEELKTAVEKEAVEKRDSKRKIAKWKRNKNLKMSGFCAVFNCSNCADWEKDKSIHRFPSIVKNNDKEALKLLKVRKEKWLAQIFKKYFTEKKLGRTWTRIKIMLSASPSSVFSHKVHNIKFEKQIRILS